MIFKFFKLLIGLLFLPVILGIFLAVFFWANNLIDTIYLNAMKLVSQPILTIMSGGIFILTGNVVLIIIKMFLYKSIWKNKYRLLHYFTDNQLNEPEILEKVNEKTTEIKDRAKDVTVGGLEVAAGAYTGNQMLLADGVGKMMPKADKAMNLGKYHFKEDEDTNSNSRTGLDGWLNTQDEVGEEKTADDLSHVEFVETDADEPVDSQLSEVDEGVDHSVDNDMAGMLSELSEDILKDGDTVSVGNLEEIILDSDNEESDRLAFEQVERETYVGLERDDYELDREYPEEIFFRNVVDKEMTEED